MYINEYFTYKLNKKIFFVTIFDVLRLAFVRHLEWYTQQLNNLL